MTTGPMGPMVKAGWYAAPDGQPYQRWWDGTAWTDRTQPLVPVAHPARSVSRVPVRTSHTFHLIMSFLTLGLWAVFVWLPITIINRMSSRRVVTRYR